MATKVMLFLIQFNIDFLSIKCVLMKKKIKFKMCFNEKKLWISRNYFKSLR